MASRRHPNGAMPRSATPFLTGVCAVRQTTRASSFEVRSRVRPRRSRALLGVKTVPLPGGV
eukprot:7749313-Alexandrium_andersonii.AAC.1